MKTVRITFRSEITIEGDSLADIKKKFEEMPLFSKEANQVQASFIEINSVEDANTLEDISSVYNNA